MHRIGTHQFKQQQCNDSHLKRAFIIGMNEVCFNVECSQIDCNDETTHANTTINKVAEKHKKRKMIAIAFCIDEISKCKSVDQKSMDDSEIRILTQSKNNEEKNGKHKLYHD